MDYALRLELAQTVYGLEDFRGRNKFDVVEIDNIEVGRVETGEGARNGIFDPCGRVVEFRSGDATAFRYEVITRAGVIGEDLWLLEGATFRWIRL